MSNPDFRAMNEQMAQRLLGAEPQPIVDGGYGLRVLEVPGRSSGQLHQTPVGVLMVDDTAHLVSPDRRRDWPSNVAAEGRCTVRGGDERTDYSATELHGLDAARVVHAYLSVVTVPWARDAFGVAPDAEPEAILDHVDAMAVFALTPVTR